MIHFSYREFKTSDLGQISELIHTRHDSQEKAEQRLVLFQWLAHNNPGAKGRATYFVVEDNGKLVGYLGRMPVKFTFEGNISNGFFVHDLYVHPDYRKGYGLFLAMGLYEIAEKESDSFCCGLWATALNIGMLRRRKYIELKAEKFVKIINPLKLLDPRREIKIPFKTALVKVLHPPAKMLLSFIDLFLLNFPGNNITIKKVGRFDNDFDDFYKHNMKKFGYSVFRDTSYMNWKFVDKPFSKNTIYSAQRNGTITGYIILGAQPKGKFLKATILDIIADPDDPKTIAALCRAALKHFKKGKVYSVNCLLTDKRYSKIFRKHLFFKDPSQEPIFIANLKKLNKDNYDLFDINKWHFSYGDSDGSMLRT